LELRVFPQYLNFKVDIERGYFTLELKKYGVILKGVRDGTPQLILVTDEERLSQMLEKHKARIDDIIERELIRLARIKGLEIEDERAKTHFLCAVGYLLRIDLEREKCETLLKELEWKGVDDAVSDVTARVRQYDRILMDIRGDAIFGRVVESFGQPTYSFETVEGVTTKYEVAIDGTTYRNHGYFWIDRDRLGRILKQLTDNYEHLTLSILGKIISGK
jgi:hypothetical protein